MGRKKNKRERLGHLEQRRLRAIVARIRKYPLQHDQAGETETSLNAKMNDWLRTTEPTWTRCLHRKVPFAGVNFNPDGTLGGQNGRRPLVAYEGKKLKLDDENPQKAWKEGIGQAFTYRVLFKTAILVLYDFTPDAQYARALGKGNSVESTFAARIRKKWRITVVPLTPR